MWVDRYAAEITTVLLGLDTVPKVQTKWEHVIHTNNNGAIMGFVDLAITAKTSPRNTSLLIEAKAEIPSLGELIRQIRMYQDGRSGLYGDHVWVVISPDDRFASKLEEQYIRFLKYDPARTFSEIIIK